MSLKGKKVIVIGGSSGIGLATARAVAAAGARVVIAGRSAQKLERARGEIGGRPGLVALDVTRDEEVRNFFERAGEFDHLVTTAAAGATGSFLDLPPEAVRDLFESKFWGQYRAARYAAGQIREGGSITFFSGVASQKPLPGFSSFAAVNGAVNALCRALAVELAPVRVNAISPGIIETPAYAAMEAEVRQEFFDRTAAALPAGRIGRPAEVAEAVLFLMRNGFVTGAVLDIDGGGRLS
ncbi:MAG: SDR family oxidoreductase [Desulfuromonadales bacterium]